MNQKFHTYLFEYAHDGQTWGFEIKASSLEDARERLSRLSLANYRGVVQMKVPVELGVFVRIACWFRNLFN